MSIRVSDPSSRNPRAARNVCACTINRAPIPRRLNLGLTQTPSRNATGRVSQPLAFSHRNFCETGSSAVTRFCNKAPSVIAAQHFVNHFGVVSWGFIRPKGNPHVQPDRPVIRAHLSYGEFHPGDRIMRRGLKVGFPTLKEIGVGLPSPAFPPNALGESRRVRKQHADERKKPACRFGTF